MPYCDFKKRCCKDTPDKFNRYMEDDLCYCADCFKFPQPEQPDLLEGYVELSYAQNKDIQILIEEKKKLTDMVINLRNINSFPASEIAPLYRKVDLYLQEIKK